MAFDLVLADVFLIGVVTVPFVELFLGLIAPALSNFAFFLGRSSSDSMADKLEPSSMSNVDGSVGLLTLDVDLVPSFFNVSTFAGPFFAFFSLPVGAEFGFDGLSLGLTAPTGSRPFLLRPR